MTTQRNYEIRGRDAFYVIRQFTAGTLQLVVGEDGFPGGYWSEWADDYTTAREIKNQARRMIRAARNGMVELPIDNWA